MFECLWCTKVRKCERWRVAWEKAKQLSTDGNKRGDIIHNEIGCCKDYEEERR